MSSMLKNLYQENSRLNKGGNIMEILVQSIVFNKELVGKAVLLKVMMSMEINGMRFIL